MVRGRLGSHRAMPDPRPVSVALTAVNRDSATRVPFCITPYTLVCAASRSVPSMAGRVAVFLAHPDSDRTISIAATGRTPSARPTPRPDLPLLNHSSCCGPPRSATQCHHHSTTRRKPVASPWTATTMRWRRSSRSLPGPPRAREDPFPGTRRTHKRERLAALVPFQSTPAPDVHN